MNSRKKVKEAERVNLFSSRIKTEKLCERQDNKEKEKREKCRDSSCRKGGREGHCTEKETETKCPGYWQPVDRETESDNQGTAGNTGERGTAGLAHSKKHEQGRV